MTQAPWEKKLKADPPFSRERAQEGRRRLIGRLAAEAEAVPGRSGALRRRTSAAMLTVTAAAFGTFLVWQMSTGGGALRTAAPAPEAGQQAPAVSIPMKGTVRFSLGDEEEFRKRYGELIREKFPELEIIFSKQKPVEEGGGGYLRTFERMVDEELPDVIVLDSFPLYKMLAQHGKLADLTPLFGRDRLEAETRVPAVMEALKGAGGGKLYGLAPAFEAKALYYNKKLFDEFGIPYPVNGMTWEEVLELARKFSRGTGESKIYGYSEKDALLYESVFVRQLAHSYGLHYTDSAHTRVTMDTPEWKKVWQLALDAYRTGTVPMRVSGNPADGNEVQLAPDYFYEGKAALTLESIELRERLKDAAFDYGIVMAPVDPSAPAIHTTLQPGPIFAVRAGTSKSEQAWEIVKYVNSLEAAEGARTQGLGRLTRTPKRVNIPVPFVSTLERMVNDQYGSELSPFYEQTLYDNRFTVHSYNMDDVLPYLPFYAEFEGRFTDRLNEVLEGRLSVEEALRQLQAEGEAFLEPLR
ncbi:MULTISPECIES: ABC transporter substrate-binding protein [Paenibacillus]|uniref:ABC transporter substrate-binding protein n=1 Tax=Paenibacillus TaxID=44249 RepID=UPI0022B927EF|nr:extracellular solute-binding protein [Paenibacillus caseinilyticus]MCZ8520344.1 extracellular solute-binding protein [Paenibacillus caseinilyticus]